MELAQIYALYKENPVVTTDSRNIPAGSIFFALKGEKFDGNQYAADAISKGAAYAVVDDATVVQNDRIILVDDVLVALQGVARLHRESFKFPVIGLTGSNGKTTTKELLYAVLSKKYQVHATKGNLNNHIGVPLTLLAINPAETNMAVIEMGANHQGEIMELCTIARPTHGLITNVGKAHLGGFGGFDGVKKAKGELYDFLSKKKGIVFVNAANDLLMDMVSKRRAFGEIVFYNSVMQENKPVLVRDNSAFIAYSQEDQTVCTQLVGEYNFDNIAAALTVAQYFNISSDDANAAVSGYVPDNNRSQVVVKNSNTIFLDAYNANPSSMAAALENFQNVTANKKMVILGDMLELGDESEKEHEALGELVASGNYDHVILFGHEIRAALKALPRAYYFPDKFSLHNWVMDNPQQDTHILIKGSRGVGLETVVQFI